MKKFFKCKKKSGYFYLLQAVLLNIGILFLAILFFSPTLKCDDYYLGEIAYGSVSGVFDVHLVYNNIFLGYFIRLLLNIFPHIAWYTILQIFCIFYAFSLFSYWFLKNDLSVNGMIIILTLLIVFGYECYVRITFTKTAAVLIAIGLFLIFSCVEQKAIKSWLFLGSSLCVFLGILYRRAVLNSVLAIVIGIAFLVIIKRLTEKTNGRAIQILIIYGITISIICAISSVLAKYNSYVYAQDKEWCQYYSNNDWKSKILDYTINNYESYQTEYSKIGVSQNDLSLIYSNDLYDMEYLSSERIEDIITIASEKKDNTIFLEKVIDKNNILEFLRLVPLAYLKRPCFIMYIILSFLVFLYRKRESCFLWFYTTMIMMGENYYLFLLGRVLHPHVDVGIIFSACLVVLYSIKVLDKKIVDSSGKNPLALLIFLLSFNTIIDSYDSISAPYFTDYGSSNACNPGKSKEIMDILTEDKENLYVTISKESVYSKWSFDAFEVIPRGYYGNIYVLGSALWPSQCVSLKNYNVENIYKELTNANHIYFFISDDLEDKGTREILTYIKEHYDDNVEMIKVKEFGTINIYRYVSENIQIEDLPEGKGSVISDLQLSISEETIQVEGYCFLENSNSYNGKSFIEITDSETNEKFYYHTLQKENYKMKDEMNGRFSAIEACFGIPDYWSEGDSVNVVLQAEGYTYRIPLNMRK